MTEQRCVVCERVGPDRQRIENEDTGEQVSICWECLHSRMRARADASDERARRLLSRDAERFGWHLWRTATVVYLLPPIEDASVEDAEGDPEPVVDVTHG
jgi:hypothetical protein